MFNVPPMIYPDVTLRPNSMHKAHPFNNVKNHDYLLTYLQQRLRKGKEVRDSDLGRLASIDKSVAGWMRLSQEDRKRRQKEEQDGSPQATKMNLPLSYVQIDDMMTYYAQTFAPNRGMFYSMGDPEEQETSADIVTIMNNHAIYAGYFRQTLLALHSCLKYNQGGFTAAWSQDYGPKISEDENGNLINKRDVVWSGNRVEALDNYNTFLDPSVHPTEIYQKGEWAGRAFPVSHFELQMKAQDGVYYNCEKGLATPDSQDSTVYYRSPPSEARMDVDESGAKAGSSQTDWVAILSMTPQHSHYTGYEVAEIIIKLNPYQMNLVTRSPANKVTRNRIEMWKFSILNDSHIIEAQFMNNVHGHIPYYVGMINDDLMSTSQKSVAEILMPLQNFASFLMNTHIAATRKNIWGLTIYDSSIVDLSAIPQDEMVNAKVAAKPSGRGKNMNDAIYEHKGTLDTKQTMQDLESTFSIIDQFFPTTSMPSQIASIDRAVDSQVAAVQQGANRRMQKGAKLLDDSLFRPMRHGMYYNILQYQNDGAEITDFYGKSRTVDLTKLRSTDLPFIIGQGLKAIDRQAAATQLQKVIFALIQSPAAQEVNILAMIDYWTSMIDIDMDMNQFQKAPEQMAAQAQAEDGITPAVNPLAVTGPLTKPGVGAPSAIGNVG